MDTDTESEGGISPPVGLFAILNGLIFYYYLSCLMFSALWRLCDQEGKPSLMRICCRESDAAEVAEQIGVGVVAALGILNSIINVIAVGVSENNCGTSVSDAFLSLNVLVTVANVGACTQVFVAYYKKVDIKETLITKAVQMKRAELFVNRQSSLSLL